MIGWLLERWRRRYSARINRPAIRAIEAAIREARRQYVADFTPP